MLFHFLKIINFIIELIHLLLILFKTTILISIIYMQGYVQHEKNQKAIQSQHQDVYYVLNVH
jgi:hypothetical protein